MKANKMLHILVNKNLRKHTFVSDSVIYAGSSGRAKGSLSWRIGSHYEGYVFNGKAVQLEETLENIIVSFTVLQETSEEYFCLGLSHNKMCILQCVYFSTVLIFLIPLCFASDYVKKRAWILYLYCPALLFISTNIP